MSTPDIVVARTSLRDVVAGFFGGKRQPDIKPATDPNDARALGGAGTAMKPVEPKGTDPRSLIVPTLYNTAAKPRTGTGVTLAPFEQLRAVADFDMFRVLIKDAKDQILGMDWTVRVRPEFKERKKQLLGRIDEVRAFIECPDPLAGIEWSDWCGSVAEEIMVTDALTLLPRMDVGGRLIGLEQIDGATIVPLVDDRGRPALPPNPAYQQIVRGMPETEFLFGELLYLPRNRRANSPYGRSNIENVLFTANLALRQTLHELAFYTDGNVPDGGMWSLPEGATTEQMVAWQEALDTVAQGRADRRSGYMRVMPPGKYSSAKDRQWSYEFLEWLWRVAAWGFGASPIPIAKQMNRSTGETLESSSMEGGPRPIAKFIANTVNRALRTYGGVTEVEFAWAEDEADNAMEIVQRQNILMGRGATTINQVREEQGDDPYDFDTPPMIDTPSGPQLLEKLIEDLKNPPEPPVDPNAPPPASGDDPSKPAPADKPPADDEAPTAQEKAWAAAFTKYRAAVVVDLRKWRDVAVKRAKEGRVQKLQFTSSVIPLCWRKEVALGVSTCKGQFTDRVSVEAVFKLALSTFKGELPVTGKRLKIEKAITALFDGWFSALEKQVLPWALDRLPSTTKGSGPDWDAGHLADDLAKQLQAGAALGAADGAVAIGVNLDRVPEYVITYARKRAGELIGRQYVAGQWIESTTGSAISDKLRATVEAAIAKAIEEKWTPAELSQTLKSYFEISRAQTIGRTETGFAYGNGAAELYKSEGVESLNVYDGPGCLPFGHDDGAQKPEDLIGTVQASAEAEGQVWTVSQYQGAILGHPNCVRVAVPYFADNAQAA